MPPPGRPMLPSSCCRMPAARMICTPIGVLRPGDGVGHRAGPLRARVVGQRLGHLEELLLRAAAYLLDHLGRVAREVPLQDLEDAVAGPAASGRVCSRRRQQAL